MNKKTRLQGIQEVHTIFSQIRKSLRVNKSQTNHRKLFSIMEAIEDVPTLLDRAWKVSKLYNLQDDHMNRQFIEIVDEFGQLKRELKHSFLDKKH